MSSKQGVFGMTTGTIKRSSRIGSDAPKPQRQVNVFHQRLGSLTVHQACKLLGEDGLKRLTKGAQAFEIILDRDVFLGGDLLRITVRDPALPNGRAIVTITLQSGRQKQLHINCDHADPFSLHTAAALAYLMDAKSLLGLAAPPDESVPLECLTADELLARALDERRQRAETESMTVRSLDKEKPWTDYVVTSVNSGKTYRVALRGTERGQSYCSCPDFRMNGLGICKHILNVQIKTQKRFSVAKLRAPYFRKNLSLRLDYAEPIGLRFNLPTRCDEKILELVDGAHNTNLCDPNQAIHTIQALSQQGYDVHVYPDAEEFIQRGLTQNRLRSECQSIRQDTKKHPLRTELLSVPLLPYQLDGIAFAVGTGRAILADDMGLGKTIQGIGVAELLARLADIHRVLVVCPASLKSQWQGEINRFCHRSNQLIAGRGEERIVQYRNDTFFTICNYEQVVRDLTTVESVPWDLIILDEGQRIKNWESQTSATIRSLRSPFRLVLSGTPLENQLGDLFTVVRFVDEHRLGPAHTFFNKHRIVDDRGKIIGYRKLDELRQSLQPILLRRTRGEVAKQLPDRTDEIVRILPTEEQKELSDGHLQIAAQIASKKFLTEMDLLRLQKSLLMARMAADSTYLLNKEEPEYSSKLERLDELLSDLISDPTRKIVLFSEWRTMLDRIETRLDRLGCDYVRLDGQVPQKKRAAIVHRFQNNPVCRVILMTNAGSTGLNLQSANTVINVDLPWNPAVLEQRIARAHRMGQKNPVHVYKLVTTDTIEERLLETLASKQDLANAALDMDSDVESVEMSSGIADLKKRLEKILTPPLPAPVDQSNQRRTESQAQMLQARREGVAAATGQLVGAALSLAGQLLQNQSAEPPAAAIDQMTEKLASLIETDAEGRLQIKISLPDQSALRDIATTLARLIG
ncbi:MAG: DEAD/DEAH box helicase [Pirellula sp.]